MTSPSVMPQGTRLRLNTPTIAVTLDEAGTKVAAIVPAGAIVVLVDDMPEGSGLMVVEWSGTMCQMFSEDLRTRGEAIARHALSAGR
jgi:hypothetical protein